MKVFEGIRFLIVYEQNFTREGAHICDLGLYVSADVRAGIRQSYAGRFFATEDGFRAFNLRYAETR